MSTDLEKIRTDSAAVTEAMRRLLEAAFAEDTALINKAGRWPEDVQNSLTVAAITHPVGFACRKAADVMLAQLATLVGKEAAEAQFNALMPARSGTRPRPPRSTGSPRGPKPFCLRDLNLGNALSDVVARL